MVVNRSRAEVVKRSKPRLSLKGAVRVLASRFGVGLQSLPVWAAFSNSAGWSDKVAMQLSAVFRAVKLNAETIGSLPVHVYRWDDDGPTEVEDGQTAALLRRPHPDYTTMEFFEAMVASMEFYGDGVALKEKIGSRVVALRPLDCSPGAMEIFRNESGRIVFRTRDPKGNQVDYSSTDVLHFKGFSFGGVRGISTIAAGAQSMGIASASQRAAVAVYKKGLRASGFVQTQGSLKESQREQIQHILDQYMGADAAGGVMLLDSGMKFESMGVSAKDAELLATRRFEVEEIGRWFGTPPILLGHSGDGITAWGSGIDAIIQSWMTLGLRQRLVRMQQCMGDRLLTAEERGHGQYVRYNPDALLAVNSTARISVLSQAVQNSIMSPDEARALMELHAVSGGDQVLANANLVPLAQLGQSAPQSEQVRAMLASWLQPDGAVNENRGV